MDSTVLKYFALLSKSSFEHFILNFSISAFCAANYLTFLFLLLCIKNKYLIKVIVLCRVSTTPSAPATTASCISSGYV